MATLYLVRHAKAGTRSDDGFDAERPLSNKGNRQALALADRLTPLIEAAPTGRQLLSSPAARCVQTLAPLAARLAAAIETNVAFAEGAGFDDAIAVLSQLVDGSVVCSHGDVIPETIAALERRGCLIANQPDWRKASVWVLRRDADCNFVEATSWPPPDVANISPNELATDS